MRREHDCERPGQYWSHRPRSESTDDQRYAHSGTYGKEIHLFLALLAFWPFKGSFGIRLDPCLHEKAGRLSSASFGSPAVSDEFWEIRDFPLMPHGVVAIWVLHLTDGNPQVTLMNLTLS